MPGSLRMELRDEVAEREGDDGGEEEVEDGRGRVPLTSQQYLEEGTSRLSG